MIGEIEQELVKLISRTFKQLIGRGPEHVDVAMCHNTLILNLQGIMNKAQFQLFSQEQHRPLIEQYFQVIMHEIIITEIRKVCEDYLDSTVKNIQATVVITKMWLNLNL